MTRLRYRALVAILVVLPTSGCLFRSHKVQSNISTAPLATATKQELIARINEQANKIQTLNATVDIDTAVGGSVKGKITEYKEIRGYLLVRKPAMLRMIGLMPIVRNRAFDVVSNGETFKLWIPPKNKFIVGRNDITTPSKQPLENIRPQMIYDSLLLQPVDLKNEIAVLENNNEMVLDPKSHRWLTQPDYELDIIRHNANDWYLSRKIIFDRTSLEPDRELMYDQNGYIATDTRYSDFKDYSGLKFPSTIHIWRPQEEYSIVLHILRLQVNQPLRDDQFALEQPPGSQLVRLDQGQTTGGTTSNALQGPTSR